MKICWDTLEKVRYNPETGKFIYRSGTLYEYDACLECGWPYLGRKGNKFCDISCSKTGKNHPMFGRTGELAPMFGRTGELAPGFGRSGELNPMFGRTGDKHPTFGRTGELNPGWKGGVVAKNIPLYDTYVLQLEPYEKCRRNDKNPRVLEVRCTYCGKWYKPTRNEVNSRIRGINNNDTYRFYCSDYCKQVCPLFGQSAQTLIRQDMIRANGIPLEELNREVQPELRKMVLARDNYICQICGKINVSLHCHHIEPVISNPIESADVDNCITLCIVCHQHTHTLPGCTYSDLRECSMQMLMQNIKPNLSIPTINKIINIGEYFDSLWLV